MATILYFIGFAGKSLQLSGCSIGRDVTFHVVSLLTLVSFFIDETLEIWENIILILIYGIYCLVMKLNGKLKNCIIKKCSKAADTGNIPMEDYVNPDANNMVNAKVIAE